MPTAPVPTAGAARTDRRQLCRGRGILPVGGYAIVVEDSPASLEPCGRHAPTVVLDCELPLAIGSQLGFVDKG